MGSGDDLAPNGEPRMTKDRRNRLGVIRVGAMAATTLVLASFAPPGLAVASFGSLAFISALVIATFAMIYGEDVGASHVTRWDEAAAMMGLSLAAGFFVDPAAVEAAIAEAGLQ